MGFDMPFQIKSNVAACPLIHLSHLMVKCHVPVVKGHRQPFIWTNDAHGHEHIGKLVNGDGRGFTSIYTWQNVVQQD